MANGKNSNNFSQCSLRAISPFILDINSNMGKIRDSVERLRSPNGDSLNYSRFIKARTSIIYYSCEKGPDGRR